MFALRDSFSKLIHQHDWLMEPKAFNAMIDSINISKDKGDTPTYGNNQDIIAAKKIAVIPVKGILMKDPDILSVLLGAINTDLLKAKIASAVNNSDISAIVLDINSPGGTVHGATDLAEFVYSIRGTKPIVAHTSGMAASAAYWLASATDIVTSFDTAFTGSIGVYVEHMDWSKYLEDNGIKATLISAGRNKVAGAYGYPLSEDDKAILQSHVDDIYKLFVRAISRNRNIPEEKIVNVIGADIYLGEKAQALGLVDKVMTFEETIELAAQMAVGKDKEELEARLSAFADTLLERFAIMAAKT